MSTQPGRYRQLTFWSEELHANPSQSLDSGKDSPTLAADSCSDFLKSLNATNLNGWSGKTCPVSCRATEDGILAPSSGGWRSSGTGGPIGSWTLSFSESPRDAVECLLSDVLETSDVPDRFYLSPKACAGILRRADKRGKTLPAMLATALQAQLQQSLSTARTPEP
jgi:hypothetical protein